MLIEIQAIVSFAFHQHFCSHNSCLLCKGSGPHGSLLIDVITNQRRFLRLEFLLNRTSGIGRVGKASAFGCGIVELEFFWRDDIAAVSADADASTE